MELLVLFTVVLVVAIDAIEDQPCRQKRYGPHDIVCVCNANYCDTINPVNRLSSRQYVTYTSSITGLRFHKEVKNFETSARNRTLVHVNETTRYQTILGFGGAFTDSAGINIYALNARARTRLLRSYYSKEGIEYTIGRVPIGGTDFSTHAYSYDDTPEPDPKLKHFKLQREDFVYKIPLVKIAQNLTGGKLMLFSSAWTAPRWMKTNNEYVLGHLKPEMFQPWADYFVRFLDAYKANGINFWAITTGNEPSAEAIPIAALNTVGWRLLDMSRWIRENLKPTLLKSAHSNIKIIALDDNILYLPLLYGILRNNQTRSVVNGIGLHWYFTPYASNSWLSIFHGDFPEIFILNTEACEGVDKTPRVAMGAWERAETYTHDIITSIQNWSTGWIDWNIALDTEGGPNYIENFVDSPIIVNASVGEFYKQPMFYALGHFSKFVPYGSVRIGIQDTYKDLFLLALLRPDKGKVVVVFNKNENNQTVTLNCGNNRYITTNSAPRSITTIVYW